VQSQNVFNIGIFFEGIHKEDFCGTGNPKDIFNALLAKDFHYGLGTS
jgi:hypothetical protein